MQEKTVRERQARTAPQPFKGTEKMKSPSLMQFSRKAGNDGMLKTLRQQSAQESRQGLPEPLKSNLEAKSGFSMDDVVTHYNSDKPAQLSALAYTQGSDIYMAPGQEKTLGHEAWHVVQQKQGGVSATMQIDGVGVNDSAQLEREADIHAGLASESASGEYAQAPMPSRGSSSIVQRIRIPLPMFPATANPSEKEKKEQESEVTLLDNARIVQTAEPGNDEVLLNSRALKQYQDGDMGSKNNLLSFNNSQTASCQMIGVHEDIIFMGHGVTSKPGTAESQAKIDPDMLAEIAYNVKKPDDWCGKIVLMGCSTGSLAERVSKKYYDLSNNEQSVKKKSVEVYGPNEDINLNNEGKASKHHTNLPSETREALTEANNSGHELRYKLVNFRIGLTNIKKPENQSLPDFANQQATLSTSLETMKEKGVPSALSNINAAKKKLKSRIKKKDPLAISLTEQLDIIAAVITLINTLRYCPSNSDENNSQDSELGYLVPTLANSLSKLECLYLTPIDFANPTSEHFTIVEYK